MVPKKQNRMVWVNLCLTVLLCGLALFLTIGRTEGRYRSPTKTQELCFKGADEQPIFLWQASDGQTLQTLTDWTQTGERSKQISFQVTNGIQDAFCAESMNFCVRAAASLGIQNPDNIQMILQIQGKEYVAKPTAILEGSSRYETFGPGWVYGFYDLTGAELTWELVGGKYDQVQATLTVTGEGEYTSLIQLEVVAFEGA